MSRVDLELFWACCIVIVLVTALFAPLGGVT